MNVDVVPTGTTAGPAFVGRGIRPGERVLGGVREDHPEPERVVRPVALEDGDLVPRVTLPHQDREVEACRPGADAVDLHALSAPLIR